MEKTRIKELREEQGLSQKELATKLELDQRTLSNYETGKTEPNITTIKKLCNFFEVTAGYLLGIEDY